MISSVTGLSGVPCTVTSLLLLFCLLGGGFITGISPSVGDVKLRASWNGLDIEEVFEGDLR